MAGMRICAGTKVPFFWIDNEDKSPLFHSFWKGCALIRKFVRDAGREVPHYEVDFTERKPLTFSHRSFGKLLSR